MTVAKEALVEYLNNARREYYKTVDIAINKLTKPRKKRKFPIKLNRFFQII